MILAEILGPDLLILLAVAALLFGSSRLPQLARSLGSAKREFEEGIREGHVAQPATEEAPSEMVTLSRAELDALIADQEASAQRHDPPTH